MKRYLALCGALLIAIAPPAAAAAPSDLTVTFDKKQISAVTGQVLPLESLVSNPTNAPTGKLIAHINVTSLDGVYVDLEDWSQDVTAHVDPVPAGGEAPLDWEVQAVNTGRFAIYVVLLSADGAPLLASPPVQVTVTARRPLNAGGALPVAIGVPLLTGLIALATRYRRTG